MRQKLPTACSTAWKVVDVPQTDSQINKRRNTWFGCHEKRSHTYWKNAFHHVSRAGFTEKEDHYLVARLSQRWNSLSSGRWWPAINQWRKRKIGKEIFHADHKSFIGKLKSLSRFITWMCDIFWTKSWTCSRISARLNSNYSKPTGKPKLISLIFANRSWRSVTTSFGASFSPMSAVCRWSMLWKSWVAGSGVRNTQLLFMSLYGALNCL